MYSPHRRSSSRASSASAGLRPGLKRRPKTESSHSSASAASELARRTGFGSTGGAKDDDFGRVETVDDLIWKARDQHAPGLGIVATEGADLGTGLNQGHRLGHGIKELAAETWTPLLVPPNSVDQLVRRGLAGANRASHRSRISFSILRFTASQGSSWTVPASIAATRRVISTSHAASASGSAGPSRLASSSAASSARASTSSLRASARTASAALVIEESYVRLGRPTSGYTRRRPRDGKVGSQ